MNNINVELKRIALPTAKYLTLDFVQRYGGLSAWILSGRLFLLREGRGRIKYAHVPPSSISCGIFYAGTPRSEKKLLASLGRCSSSQRGIRSRLLMIIIIIIMFLLFWNGVQPTLAQYPPNSIGIFNGHYSTVRERRGRVCLSVDLACCMFCHHCFNSDRHCHRIEVSMPNSLSPPNAIPWQMQFPITPVGISLGASG